MISGPVQEGPSVAEPGVTVRGMDDETQPGRYRTDVVKPFCPCDTGRPQDCRPEDWPGAHAEPPCLNCGRKSYTHFGTGRFCERPASWPPCQGNPDSAAHERIEPLDVEEWHCADCGDTGPFP